MIERADGAGDGVGQRAIAGRHVVERTMGLHMRERHAFRGGDRRQRADLIEHQILDLARRRAQLPPPESHEVGKPRMRAHRDAGVAGQPDGLPHHARIAGMKATRDVGGGDAPHHLGIGPEPIRTEGFADVAVEVDGGHRLKVRSLTFPLSSSRIAAMISIA